MKRIIVTPRKLFTVLLFLGLFTMTLRPVADPDFWWHLSTGQWIFQTGRIPSNDPFSVTRLGYPWIAHEWLSELFIFILYKVGGYPLLIPVFSLIISFAYFLVFQRSSGKPYAAGFAVILAALASAPTWGVRPQMISLLMTAFFLFILDVYMEKRKWKILVYLPILTILWVNMHAGFILGFFIIGIYIFVEVIQIARTIYKREKPIVQTAMVLIVLLLICIIASLINPNSYFILIYPFKTLMSTSMMQFIQEWFSPDFHQTEWIPLAALIAGLIILPNLKNRPISLIRLLLLIIFVIAALRSMRFVPIFSLVTIPVIAEQLTGSVLKINQFKSNVHINKLSYVFVLICLLLIGFYFFSILQEQPRIEKRIYPQQAVEWIHGNQPEGNIFNTYGWGGYLIWKLYPDYLVFIDGRADIYGDDFIFNYIRTYNGQKDWESNLENSDVRLVIVEPDSGLANVMIHSPVWSLQYEDSVSLIFVKE